MWNSGGCHFIATVMAANAEWWQLPVKKVAATSLYNSRDKIIIQHVNCRKEAPVHSTPWNLFFAETFQRIDLQSIPLHNGNCQY